ncbi:MBL fold metallo-hydrolase [Aquamicrobium segne]|uniref:MBL fold metallo-hydrolase n=1 Tax=Aquamicrobium segne TaxID=469547 RepID=A0ABW0GV30_9HYPH
MTLEFDTVFEPAHGSFVKVAPNVLRVTAPNASPFTFHGTNSYIVGRDTLALIDPGPDDERHLKTLLEAIAGRPVSHIFVSHTHRDHSPLAARLQALTGARTLAYGPYRPARMLSTGQINTLDESHDTHFTPDITLPDNGLIDGDGWAIRAIHTPGHAANHMAFALENTGLLFSADHVMSWSTSIIAPPDGNMADYMASLDRLLERDDQFFLPGHGGPVRQPQAFMRGLKAHRKMRERIILERLKKGDRTIPEMVRTIYRKTDPHLHSAAGLSVLAHLEDLVSRGLVTSTDTPAIDSIYELRS